MVIGYFVCLNAHVISLSSPGAAGNDVPDSLLGHATFLSLIEDV